MREPFRLNRSTRFVDQRERIFCASVTAHFISRRTQSSLTLDTFRPPQPCDSYTTLRANTCKVMFSFLRPVSVFTKVAKTPSNDRQNLLNVNHAAARFSCHSCQRGECRLAVYQRTYDRSHSNANSQPPITAAVTWNGCHVCVLRAIIPSLPKNNSARR